MADNDAIAYPDLNIDSYELENIPDYHAVFSIQLCELFNNGLINFSSEDWNFDAYDTEQRNRFWNKFKRRFWYREIGIMPPSIWQWELLRKLDEIMPKYKPLYQMLDDGVNIMQKMGEYGKSRNVFSDFPQTMLSGTNQDYASNATDREHEEIYIGDWLDTVARIKTYDDIDVMILKELETMFCAMFSVAVNGY